MKPELTDAEREHLRQLQKQRRDDEGYVKVTVVLMLDAGWGAGQVAQTLGSDDGTVYRYAQAQQRVGVATYLLHETPGYWYSIPDLMQLLHRLATVQHDPFTVASSDADYDRNNRSLFAVGQPLGGWYTYQQCPQTLALLDRVAQDVTYYVFSFKQQFSRPRPYNREPRLKNYEAPGHASYPGHSSLSYVNAYVLEELAPDLKAKFYANAAELTYSREVIGVRAFYL